MCSYLHGMIEVDILTVSELQLALFPGLLFLTLWKTSVVCKTVTVSELQDIFIGFVFQVFYFLGVVAKFITLCMVTV